MTLLRKLGSLVKPLARKAGDYAVKQLTTTAFRRKFYQTKNTLHRKLARHVHLQMFPAQVKVVPYHKDRMRSQPRKKLSKTIYKPKTIKGTGHPSAPNPF